MPVFDNITAVVYNVSMTPEQMSFTWAITGVICASMLIYVLLR